MNPTVIFIEIFLFIIVYAHVMCEGRVSQDLPSAENRATLTLHGFVEYYWNQDPVNENISFFFSCGQIGGGGSPGNWTQCSCYYPSSCLNCYRWWDAIAMESIATYGIYMNSTNLSLSEIPENVFSHSPYNGDFYGQYTFIDDFAWYGIAYLRVYEWLNVCLAIIKHAVNTLARIMPIYFQ